jgi:hypothetical protein
MAMNSTDPLPTPPAQRWLVCGAYMLAALVGLVTSYDFGRTIGGPLVGVVLALNGALFCSIVAGALAERLCRWWPAAMRGTSAVRRHSVH